MKSTHDHPNPALNRLSQWGALVLFVVMLVAAAAQFAVALRGGTFAPFACGGLFTALLALPVLMLTASAPALTVSPEGLTLSPVVWREHFVPWSAVAAYKDYPLLPSSDSEVGRKLMVGRRKYRPAEGKLLVIPALSPVYRVHGFFCGEGFTPAVGFTNRSHADYERLAHKVAVYLEPHLPVAPTVSDGEGTTDAVEGERA